MASSEDPISDVELLELFKLFDHDNRGYVTPADICRVLGLLGQEVTEEHVTNILNAEKNGEMDFVAFCEVMKLKGQALKEELQKNIQDAFQIIDKGTKGILTTHDICHVMTRFGENFTEMDAMYLIKQADSEDKGYMTKEDFLKLMLKR